MNEQNRASHPINSLLPREIDGFIPWRSLP